jgi:tetratricopeptide (TPR) repeat protein
MQNVASVGAYSTVALVFADTSRVDAAVAVFKTALDRFTDAQYKDQLPLLLFNYAAVLKRVGDGRMAAEQFDKAAKICNALIAENPKLVEPYRILGNVFAENGDFTNAVDNFQKAVELQPDNPENYMNLIQAFEASDKLDIAIQTAQKAIPPTLSPFTSSRTLKTSRATSGNWNPKRRAISKT